MHYKAWACKILAPERSNGVPKEEQVIYEDEIGREIGDDMGPRWREALRNEEHLHGPKITKWRLRAYVEYMSTETDQQAASLDTGRSRVAGRKAKKSTPPMMLARLTALTCFCRVEAILFDEPLTKPLDDITKARQLLAVKLRQLHDFQFEQCVDPHRGSLDDVYTEEQFRILVSDILPYWAKEYFRESMSYPSQSLWRALADASFQLNTKHLITQLRAEVNLHKEEGGKKEIKIKGLEQKVESLEREKAAMQAELEAKAEALALLQKAFDALKITAATTAAANVGGSESVPQTATEETTPPPQQPPQSTPTQQSTGSQLDQTFFDAVVWPWCTCETVRQAWSYWDGPSPLNDGHSLRHAYRRGFAVKYSKFTPTPPTVPPGAVDQPAEKPPTPKAVESRLRKMEVVMRAVEMFRVDDSRAATSTIIDKLDSIVKNHSINMLAEGLVLKEDSGKQLTKKRKIETADDNRKDKDRLRITRELIRVELRTTKWAENVFKDKWIEFMKTLGESPSSTGNRDEGGN
ncbi:unnamed protein product [Closterium sp. NIES-65]|nr:unnamed protein product [Closterium sp. NIES-65]